MITFDEVSKVYPDGTTAVDKPLSSPGGSRRLAWDQVMPKTFVSRPKPALTSSCCIRI